MNVERFVVSLSLAGLAGLPPSGPLGARERPVVSATHAREGRLDRTLTQAAALYPYEKVQVFARATGYAREVRADLGDAVETGQTLAVLEVPEQEAALRAAAAEVAIAEAGVERARAQVRRREAVLKLTRDLFQKGGRNQFQLEEAEAEHQVAGAELELAGARHREALARQERLEALAAFAQVRAPFAGVITQRFVHTGALVREGSASGAEPLFEVERVDRLRLRVEVPERDSVLVLESHRHGKLAAAITLDALGDSRIELAPDALSQPGAVRFARSLHPRSHHMLAEILLENTGGRLLPGLFGKVALEARGAAGGPGVLVPNTALRAPRGGEPFVFVLRREGGRTLAVHRPVRLGVTDGSWTEVLSGLEAGEELVELGGGDLLETEEGQEVLVAGERGGEKR